MSVQFTSSGATSCAILRTTHVAQPGSVSGSTGCTVAFWMRITVYADWVDPFRSSDGGLNYYGLEAFSGGSLYVHRRNTFPNYSSADLWTDGYTGWAYIVLRTDGTTLTVSHWRESTSTWVWTAATLGGMNLVPALTEMDLGGVPAWAPDVNGTCLFRELRIWGSYLSDAQVESERPSTTPVFTTGLMTWNPLTSAATAGDDASAIDEDWTVVGTPVDSASNPSSFPSGSGTVLYAVAEYPLID